jgi:hypothetical protein
MALVQVLDGGSRHETLQIGVSFQCNQPNTGDYDGCGEVAGRVPSSQRKHVHEETRVKS